MKKQLTEAQRNLQKLAGIITEDAPVTIKKVTSNKDESTPFDAGKAVTKMLKESLTNPRLVTENPGEFQALEKELDSLQAKDLKTGEILIIDPKSIDPKDPKKKQAVQFDGDDVSFMTDEESDEIYVEILPARKQEFGDDAAKYRRKIVMQAIKQTLDKYPAYKIDPGSKESFDGVISYTIVNKSALQ